MKYEVKLATEADRKWAIETASKNMIMKEVKRPDLYNQRQLHLVYHKIVEDETGLIAWAGDQRVGCVGGLMMPHFLNPGKLLIFEAVWYVDEKYRNTRVPYLLMKGYRDMVVERADEGIFTILGDTPIKDESLAKMGWKLQEKHYSIRKELWQQ